MKNHTIQIIKALMANKIEVTLIIPFKGPDHVNRDYLVEIDNIKCSSNKTSYWATPKQGGPEICLDEVLSSWVYIGENKKPLYSNGVPNVTMVNNSYLYLIKNYDEIRPGHIYVSKEEGTPYCLILEKAIADQFIANNYNKLHDKIPSHSRLSPAILVHNIIDNSLDIILWEEGLQILTNI